MKTQWSLLFLIFSQLTSIAIAKFSCYEIDRCQCSATADTDTFSIHCPSTNDLQTTINFIPDKELSIECLLPFDLTHLQAQPKQDNNSDLIILPKFNRSYIEKISIKFCDLKESVLYTLQRLGLDSCKDLRLRNNVGITNLLPNDLPGLKIKLESLYLSNNQITEVEQEFFKGMTALTVLDLSENNVTLTNNQFIYLTNLRNLDLSRNYFKELHTNSFSGLTNLQLLHLWKSEIKELSAGVFDNLRTLKSLELSRNKIKKLPPHIFDLLVDLEEINIGGNKLTEIDADVFKYNKGLINIRIENNILKVLPTGLFANFTKLAKVGIHNCTLREVPSDLFKNSINLREINLEDNKLTSLPNGIFDGLVNLEKLLLNNNQITEINVGTFNSLKQLNVLSMSRNKLKILSKSMFDQLEKLSEIYFNMNEISKVELLSFYNNPELKIVNLAHNKITFKEYENEGYAPFNQNVKMVKLDLSYNLISTFFNEFSIIHLELERLNLEHNIISKIQFSDFQSSSYHRLQINLSNNNIPEIDLSLAELLAQERTTEISDGYSSNGYNTVVQMGFNPLNCDCHAYNLLRYYNGTLDPLVRTQVDIKSLDLTCASPAHLAGINVEDVEPHMVTCNVKTCPEGCTCAQRPFNNAFIVDCIRRNITKVPTIPKVPHFKWNHTEVYLQNNLLTAAPENEMGYDNVTILYLSNNLISNVNWVPQRIQEMRLDNNNISHLNYEVLSHLNNSAVLLHNNPWACDCSTMNLTNFLRDHIINEKNNIKCHRNGSSIKDLKDHEICPNTTITILISFAMILIGILMIACLVTAYYYKNTQKIKVWLYAHNLCLWCVVEEDLDKDKMYDAFISYSHKDEDFIVNELVPKLEGGPNPFKLCLHTRNWIAGEFIAKQITNSVHESRRTIVVLSPHFLDSVWGKMEFRTAHTQAMSEGRTRVIVILYGDIDPNSDLIDDELKVYLKTNTYIKWGEDSFWNKLKYALPHSQKNTVQNQKLENMMVNIDKMVLVTGPMTPNVGTTPPAIDPLLLKDKRNPLEFKIDIDSLNTPPAESGHDNLSMNPY